MHLFNILGSPFILILAFFSAFIVAYYTQYAIDERYEFAIYKPKNLKSKKVTWAIISFLLTFIFFVLINSLF